MNFFTIFIYVVLSLFAGLLLIGISPDLINDVIIILTNLERRILVDGWFHLILVCLGLLIILLCMRFIQALFIRTHGEKVISLESSNGRVSITLFAIEDILKKILKDRKELFHIKTKVADQKDAMYIFIKGNLATEVNLPQLRDDLYERIKEKMQYLLGEDKAIKVEIEIRKMTFGNEKTAEEPEVPFRNY